jgi:two-component system sensor histidine kinase RegB
VKGLDDARLVHLAWLTRMRWGALACQLLLVVAARVVGEIAVSPLIAAVPLGLGLLTNTLLAVALRRRYPVPELWVVAVFALDIATLTLLLHLTGGPLNPFSFLYLVHVAQATVALRARWAWGVGLASVAAYGALFLAPLDPHDHHGMHLHLRGMWIAFTVTALFIVFYVGSLRAALAERDRALAEAHRAEARSQRLIGLATLAGGTAHELATPLSTIYLVAFELEKKLTEMAAPAALIEDARLTLAQVERCRNILSQMAADAGEALGERRVPVPIRAVVDEALAELGRRERVALEVTGDLAGAEVEVPRRAMAQAIRGLAKNALEASESPVTLSITRAGEQVSVSIRDQGPGMSPEVLARVGEPFFTTKPTGSGMGLGVFLARTLAERFGGALDVESEPGRGSRVVLRLPLARATV